MEERPANPEQEKTPAEVAGQSGGEVKEVATGSAVQAATVLGEAVSSIPLNVAEKGDKGEETDETSALKEWVELLVRAGVWALLIYVFLFQISVVDGDSMSPSFHPGDRLVIDKVTYRFSPIQRYDVVVFEAIDLGPLNKNRAPKDYIKRVIGLPGETVEIHGGAVWVNGKKLEDEFGLTYPTTTPDASMTRKFVEPEKHYFVLGDNRQWSKDSRVDRGQSLGFVPVKQIKGLVRLRFWPWKNWSWFGRQ